MVRADQGIQGRSAPRAKSRSSATASIRARSSTSAPKVAAAPPTLITKAAKRAMKRAELMSKVKPTSLLNLEPHNGALSKSSLRRQKRKQKEQLAGNTTGLRDLREAMNEVAQQVEEDDDDDDEDALNMDDDEDDIDGLQEETSNHRNSTSAAYPQVGAQKTRKDATVTEKARKKALNLEMQRQNLILSDPAYTKSPFAALRLHAQNTLAFDKGNAKQRR
ncbi:Ribosome biogenesis protein SLX9 [Pseudozyma hubeiensis]|nr:Ribosome biogenesis protein SLX9 [Pseudozyma hubeiensis]